MRLMKTLFAIWALLLAPVCAQLGPADRGNCTCHPDPHITTFDGIYYDFQSGCDAVMVKDAKVTTSTGDEKDLAVHVRLLAQIGWSAVEEVGIRIGEDVFIVNSAGAYALLSISDPSTPPAAPAAFTQPPPPANFTGITLPDSGMTVQYTAYPSKSSDSHTGGVYHVPLDANIPNTYYIEIDALGINGEGGDAQQGDRGYQYVSIRIIGHGSIFQGSNGLCGSWDTAATFTERNGTPIPDISPNTWGGYGDLVDYGNEWQVNPSGDGNVLQAPDLAKVNSNVNWAPSGNVCVPQIAPTRNLGEGRALPEVCQTCSDLQNANANQVQVQRCIYDALHLGCEFVKGSPFYDPTDEKYASFFPTNEHVDKIRDCYVHPDPHIITFFGAHFDFQRGCDVVLVKGAKVTDPNDDYGYVNGVGATTLTYGLEIHLRLKKMTGWSTIESFGIKIGGDFFLINDKGQYIKTTQSGVSVIPTTGWQDPVGSLPLQLGTLSGNEVSYDAYSNGSYNGGTYKIKLPTVGGQSFGIKVDTILPGGTVNSKSDYMSVRIHGHGSVFAGSSGLCGNWNDPYGLGLGFYDRIGTPMTLPSSGSYYDGDSFGMAWQASSVAHGDKEMFDPPHNSAFWNLGTDEHTTVLGQCIEQQGGARFLEENRRLDTCSYCSTIESQGAPPVQVQWCNEDENRLGCDYVTNAPFYDRDDPNWSEVYKCEGGSCGGDPHLKTFNGQFFSYHGECDMLLLQSKQFASGKGLDIHIRTTRIDKPKVNYSYISGMAMKLENNVLEIKDDGTILVNGVSLSDPTVFCGYPLTKSFKGKRKMIIVYNLDLSSSPDDVNASSIQIRVNTQTGMLFVDVTGRFPDSAGLLGPPRGDDRMLARDGVTDLKNEWNSFGEEWQIRGDEAKLFQVNRAPQYPQGCSYQSNSSMKNLRNRRRLLMNDSGLTKEVASVACASSEGRAKDFCIADVMATGSVDLADDEFYH